MAFVTSKHILPSDIKTCIELRNSETKRINFLTLDTKKKKYRK